MPTFSQKAANGITFYCPGAGNTDMGYFGVRKGLESAGYEGEVSAFIWTLTLLPLDQELRGLVKLRARHLSDIIDKYIETYPGRPVNLIGLSAGSGVALWAVEHLNEDHMVENVVLLGSSLSHDYDVGDALEHIHGKIYVYYSPHDVILAGPMKLFGTIDGKFGVDGAGSVGLRSKRFAERIVNTLVSRYADKFLKAPNPPLGEDLRWIRVANMRDCPDLLAYFKLGGSFAVNLRFIEIAEQDDSDEE